MVTCVTMAAEKNQVAEVFQVLQQKCSAFADAVKLAAKESGKIGSGMKAKYNELMSAVSSLTKNLSKSNEAKDMLNFPVKLACCTLLDGVTYATNKTKPLLAKLGAVQQLAGVIEFLYSLSTLNTSYEDPVRIPLESNEVYIFVDMLFKIFETIAKVEKLDDSVQLRIVETVLQLFSTSSPFMMYEDIIRRSFVFLDEMLTRKHVKPMLEGGMKQLTDCLLSAKKFKSAVAPAVKTDAIVDDILHVDLVVELISCCCSLIRNEKSEFMCNLEASNASEMLLVAITTLPKGALFEVPRMNAIAKGELYSTVKYVLAGGVHVQDGCMLLARILDHGYHQCNRSQTPDRAVLKLYESLFNFVELDLIDASTVEGMQRKLGWIRAVAFLVQSNELLNDLRNQRATRRMVVDMLNFAVKDVKTPTATELDSFFDGIYDSGHGQQLIAEQIDLMEQENGYTWSGYIKLIPVFAVKMAPDSCAMDFCNLTNGAVHKFSRFTGTESKDMAQLEIMQAAITVDMILVVSHVLYSLVVGTNRSIPQFAHYRIFYPKVTVDEGGNSYEEIQKRNSYEASDNDKRISECNYLKEIAEILIKQLEGLMDAMNSEIMHQALLTVQQALLVVTSVLGWESQCTRILNILTSHIVNVEKEFAKDRTTLTEARLSLYLLHVRAMISLLLNYPSSLNDEAWDLVMQHLITFLFMSRQLGVANRDHLKALEPKELDEIMVGFPGVKEKWHCVLTELFGAFEKMRVHDFHVLGLFVTYFGFHVIIPLLAKSHYALEPDTVATAQSPRDRTGKVTVIQRTLEHWPSKFISMIEQDGREWPQLMRDLAHSLGRDTMIANAEPEFLHCLFGAITELPFAREHDEIMMFTGIVMLLVRDYGALELMIATICRNIVSLFLAKNKESNLAIEAGVCVLYKTMCENTSLQTHVINGLKTVCTTVPHILAVSKGIITCLSFATKNATDAEDVGTIVMLIDVFVAIVEDSVDSLQDDSCLPFVQCLFILAHGSYTGDNNAAFRVIAVFIDFAEKMAAQSHFFGGTRPARNGEIEMWEALFRGLHGLGLSEFSEIRQCAIKSLAMFIKGRLNRFDEVLWEKCFKEMLMPVAEGLLNSLHTSQNTQTVFTACDEIGVALREGDDRFQKDSEKIVTTLICGLEKVVNATLKDTNIYPNELNSVLSNAVGIATNIIIDYHNSDAVWNKAITILQVMANKDLDLLKQSFYKSICSILSALGENEIVPKDKVYQVVQLALGETSPAEKRDYETLCNDAISGEQMDVTSLLPPWIFLKYSSTAIKEPNTNKKDVWPNISENMISAASKDEDIQHDELSPEMSKLRDKLETKDEERIKITLRDKIQNSLGILQDMQMLQLVTLHYSPQILTGTDALEKVSSNEIPKTLDHSQAERMTSDDGLYDVRSSLKEALGTEGRKMMLDNIIANIKVPPLMTLVQAYSPISKLFRCLVSIKSPEIYEVLVRSLVPKYLTTETSNLRLSLQLIDNIGSSVREVLVRFLTRATQVITTDQGKYEFMESKEYRMLMNAVLPMFPMLLEVSRRMVEKRTVQPVCLILYQECINIAKYVYFGLYFHVHFLELGPVLCKQVTNYWRSLLKALDFFSHLNFADDLTSRIKFIKMLHAISLEMISSMVVNPFSIAPPFVYGNIVDILDRFASGSSAVLRRIALQRLSDASCYPFIPVLLKAEPKDATVVVERVRITKMFLLVLTKHLCKLLTSKDDIEVLAALQVLESIKTIPNELLFDQEYLRRHKYLRYVQRHPLVSVAIPYLLELMESENKKVIRSTRRVLSMFLEEMGAKVSLGAVKCTSPQ